MSTRAAQRQINRPLACSSAGVPPPTPGELVAHVARFSWHSTVTLLALLNAILANQGGPDGVAIRACTIDPFLAADPVRMTPRGRALWTFASRLSVVPPAAHELSTYFLQSIAILHGMDDGPEARPEDVFEMLVTANDYAFDWHVNDAAALTPLEIELADMTRSMDFNRGGDPATAIVRGSQMLAHRPRRRTQWGTDDEWKRFQENAFGMPLDEYLTSFAIPLVALAGSWGDRGADGWLTPIIDPTSWWNAANVDHAKMELRLRSLTATREEAREALSKRARDGLVFGPAFFFRKPFMSLPDGRAVALSPPLVREHLRGGLWGIHRDQLGSRSSDWSPAFGELFEDWCQHVALGCASASVDEILVPEHRGTDAEAEDIVIKKNGKLVFVSVKGSTVRESAIRGAESRSAAVKAIERFLLAPKGKTSDGQDHGGGALRKLDAKVTKLRNGEYAHLGLDRTAKVYPMLVTYEHLFDTPAMYRWCEKRLLSEGLLQQDRVEPMTFAAVEDFEAIIALGTRGHSVMDILREKCGARQRYSRLELLLHGRKKGAFDLRPDGTAKDLDDLMVRSQRLFGRSLCVVQRDGDSVAADVPVSLIPGGPVRLGRDE